MPTTRLPLRAKATEPPDQAPDSARTPSAGGLNRDGVIGSLSATSSPAAKTPAARASEEPRPTRVAAGAANEREPATAPIANAWR